METEMESVRNRNSLWCALKSSYVSPVRRAANFHHSLSAAGRPGTDSTDPEHPLLTCDTSLKLLRTKRGALPGATLANASTGKRIRSCRVPEKPDDAVAASIELR